MGGVIARLRRWALRLLGAVSAKDHESVKREREMLRSSLASLGRRFIALDADAIKAEVMSGDTDYGMQIHLATDIQRVRVGVRSFVPAPDVRVMMAVFLAECARDKVLAAALAEIAPEMPG